MSYRRWQGYIQTGKCSGVKSPCSSSLNCDEARRRLCTVDAGALPGTSHTTVALCIRNTDKQQVGVHGNSRGCETMPLEKQTRLVNVLGRTGKIVRMSMQAPAYCTPRVNPPSTPRIPFSCHSVPLGKALLCTTLQRIHNSFHQFPHWITAYAWGVWASVEGLLCAKCLYLWSHL